MSPSNPPEHTNRLIHETSPYLLQHAHNPVDWHAWGDEAIKKARAENKPIFLSIGYSACHWCHVMERESFEDESIAAILNEHFVPIKVDREERPDLDDIYMQAVQMMTGHGGWPMSVFLTPDLRPFFGGTYFPPEDRPPMIGFRRLLQRLSDLYKNEPERVADSARQITEELKQQEGVIGTGEGREINRAMLEQAVRDLEKRYDATYGGFGPAPKFPPSMGLNLLLREHHRAKNPQLLEMAEKTLQAMALGGMYDQLGGGFHRYSTDHRWLVPHFEKMLYDNALLAPVYLDAFLVTGNPFYEQIAREILDYVLRDMTDPEGGFYSAEDADSEGEEGKFYVWAHDEIVSALGDEEGKLFCEFYDVTSTGNFEGKSILNVITPLEEFAKRRSMDAKALWERLQKSKVKLLEIRSKRVRPFRDEKVLASWNGMMISAFARGAQVTGEVRYREAAEKAATFVRDRMRQGDKPLLFRTWGKGKAKINGFIDDHAFFVTALIDVYETSFNPNWLETASAMADAMIERFYDKSSGGFFTTDGSDPTVLVRKKDTYDGATPSGNSGAVFALLRLSLLLDRSRYRELGMTTLGSMNSYLTRAPGAVQHLLSAVGFALDKPKEIVIVGEEANAEVSRMLLEVRKRYLPSRVVAMAGADKLESGFNREIALFRDRGSEAKSSATAFVCENYTCKLPVHTGEDLAKLLNEQ